MGFVNCDETHQPIAQWEVIRANHTITIESDEDYIITVN